MVQSPSVRFVTEEALDTFADDVMTPQIDTATAFSGFNQRRRPALRGVPLCVGFRSTGITTALASAQTVQVTTKWSGIAGFDASDLRVVFNNWRTNQYTEGTKPYEDVLPEQNMTLRAGIVVAGVTYQVTFGGKRDVIVEPGGFVESDPLPVDVKAGDVIRTVTYQAAGNWRVLASIAATTWGGDGAGVTTTGDYTADGSAIPLDGGGSGVVPAAITATPKVKTQRTVCIVGASDGEGVGDGFQQNGYNLAISQPRAGRWGFITRALAGKTGVIQTARTGDRVSTFVLPSGHRGRYLFLSSCSDVITTMGLNDVFNLDTLATVQANKIIEWTQEANRGCRVWQTTWTPHTTSTDNWQTTANQTVYASEAVRVGFNNWIRDGAPINYPALTPAAVGAVGAGIVRAGETNHPLYSYFEVADRAESARNSGKWRVDLIAARTDGAMTVGSNVLSTPGKTWTSADLWKLVEIAGAGPGGTALRGYVSGVSGTTANLHATSGSVVNASVAVSGANVKIGLPTVDGAHGTADLHEVMALAIDTTLLLAG